MLRVQDMSEIEGYEELDRRPHRPGAEEAGKIADDVLSPLNVIGDKEGCRLENGVVYTPTGFKEAFDVRCEGGWTGLDMRPKNSAARTCRYVLNTAVGEYPVGREHGLHDVSGPDPRRLFLRSTPTAPTSRKQTYLPKMVSGEWTGTMNLTEPHCGTDLGLMRTKAEPQEDGSYRISGQKIFISAGEHDMAENIIHLVLARTPGAPRASRASRSSWCPSSS